MLRQRDSQRLGIEAVMKKNGGAGAGTAPEDGETANVVKRQAVQPEIAGQQGQVAIRGGGCRIEIGIAEHDAARVALAAAGRDDERNVWRQRRGRNGQLVAVDWLEWPISGTAGEGVSGQVKAAP